MKRLEDGNVCYCTHGAESCAEQLIFGRSKPKQPSSSKTSCLDACDIGVAAKYVYLRWLIPTVVWRTNDPLDEPPLISSILHVIRE